MNIQSNFFMQTSNASLMSMGLSATKNFNFNRDETNVELSNGETSPTDKNKKHIKKQVDQ